MRIKPGPAGTDSPGLRKRGVSQADVLGDSRCLISRLWPRGGLAGEFKEGMRRSGSDLPSTKSPKSLRGVRDLESAAQATCLVS
jgi:hypothetical protein